MCSITTARARREGLIEATVPDIAEHGSLVPVRFGVACAMTGNDYLRTVHMVAMENPLPEIARYCFTPGCGEAEVAFRCRMRARAHLAFIADMADMADGTQPPPPTPRAKRGSQP